MKGSTEIGKQYRYLFLCWGITDLGAMCAWVGFDHGQNATNMYFVQYQRVRYYFPKSGIKKFLLEEKKIESERFFFVHLDLLYFILNNTL